MIILAFMRRGVKVNVYSCANGDVIAGGYLCNCGQKFPKESLNEQYPLRPIIRIM